MNYLGIKLDKLWKWYLISIAIVAIVAVGGTFAYTTLNNNVYGGETTLEMEIQLLKNEIAELKNTLATKTELDTEKTRIDELKIQNETLDNKTNTTNTDLGNFQNKVTEQGQILNSLKTRVSNLEQINKSKIVGTWKGVIPAVGNVTYVFNNNGTVNYSIEETNTNYIYTYNNSNVILAAGNVMFYNLTNDNIMTIYYNGIYTYKLTKVQ